MASLPTNLSTFAGAEPAWEIATLFPAQGAWSVEEYLDLTDSTNRLIEYTDGRIEVLEMPTISHQRILLHLILLFNQFVDRNQLGEILTAGLRVKLDARKFREPDIVFLQKGHQAGVDNRYWTGADLVLEIVSDDAGSRKRDLVEKRRDYAAAGIREYWIVDPTEKRITVLALEGDAYTPVGEFAPGDQAISRLLDGFSLDVTATFDAAKR